MQSQKCHVRWISKEVVRCSARDFSCEVQCYYDPERKAFTAVLGDLAVRAGLPSLLTREEAAQVQKALVESLGVKRIFGLPICRRHVYVQRQQQVS